MLPKDKQIRSVDIHYSYGAYGFQFFDRDHTLIFKIGFFAPHFDVKTVELTENEVIIGVAAKLFPGK